MLITFEVFEGEFNNNFQDNVNDKKKFSKLNVIFFHYSFTLG